jgi:hypothetical protein
MDIDDYGDQKIQRSRSKWKCGLNAELLSSFSLLPAFCALGAGVLTPHTTYYLPRIRLTNPITTSDNRRLWNRKGIHYAKVTARA